MNVNILDSLYCFAQVSHFAQYTYYNLKLYKPYKVKLLHLMLMAVVVTVGRSLRVHGRCRHGKHVWWQDLFAEESNFQLWF